ncbi:EbsA family protein [Ligilactobacillus ceti]|nr:EbsA family protein [Ligilactobacillus ceti]
MQKNYYYQPNISTSIICWSYTLMLLVFSLFLWLEITVFQIWTVISFVLFLIVAGLQIVLRKIQVLDDKVVLKTVVPLNKKEINYADITDLQIGKYQIKIKTRFRNYAFLMKPKKARVFYDYLKTQINVEQ